jgi:hypothetical protein
MRRLREDDQISRLMLRAVMVQFVAALVFAPSISVAATKWTFCVASETAAKDVWITDVFPTAARRERLEVDLKALLEREGHSRIVAQCPQTTADKVASVNAQIAAEEFNLKLGSALHEVPAREFPPHR